MRPLIVVLGELAYLRPWIWLGLEGERYNVHDLYRLAVRDLYGTPAMKAPLLDRVWSWDSDPEGRVRIWKETPEGKFLFSEEVAPT